MNVKIEKAIEADYREINALYREGYISDWKKLPTIYKKIPKTVIPLDIFLNTLADENCLTLVAKLDTKIVGVLYAFIEASNEDTMIRKRTSLCIGELSTDKRYQNQGIATKLLIESENWAKSKKINNITVLPYAHNIDVIKFYENRGFVQYSIKLTKEIK